MDGVSYARVLKSEGGLDRKAFFNYFPHAGTGRAGGVWVRSGDWKLLRWFGFAPGDEQRYELYNLREDLSEAQNLAAAQPARVQELDKLIDGFLNDTGALFPQPNPAFKAPPARPATAKADAGDPLEGWKARQCAVVVKEGILTMTGTGSAAFLGHAMGKTTGPVMLKFRVRTGAGGAGKIEWLPSGQAGGGADARSVPFEVVAGDWRELSVAVPEPGPLGTMRLYLPAGAKPLELDWVEMRAERAGGKPQRWEFDAK